MLPNIKDIFINACFLNQNEASAAFDGVISKMISGLVDGIKDVGYFGPTDLLRDMVFDSNVFSGLTSFNYFFKGADKRGLEIILRNSNTLENIVVDELPGDFIHHMLYRENGDPVVYDHLNRLSLNSTVGTMPRDTKGYTCHLPSLKMLNVRDTDPVLTNAFFNGTEKLEYLCLCTTYDTVDGINDRQMFRTCQLQNLKSLELNYGCESLQDSLSDNLNKMTQYSKFVVSLIEKPRRLQSISITSSQYEARIVDILSSSTELSNIQRLEFTMADIQFKDLVAVIRNCPQLQAIKCSAISDYPSIDGMTNEDLVGHIETEIYPLSKYLASIVITSDGHNQIEETCLAMALLVVGCPRLSKIDYPSTDREELTEYLLEKAETAMFTKYRKRLQNIVPNYEQ